MTKALDGQLKIDFDGNITEIHTNKIHKNSKGYITLASKKDDKYSQWHYKSNEIDEAIKKITKDNNIYISQNTFYQPKRRIDTIKQLRNCYVDIDCYNKNITKESALFFLEKDYYGKIPKPNMIIDSGRGLYLIWNIDAVPSQVLPLWYAVIRFLYEQLKPIGADASAVDPTRILRIAGTINSKTNTEVKILDIYDYKYTLREIRDEYLPELKTKRSKAIGKIKGYISKQYNESSLYYARLMDLVIICEFRQWDMQGKREIICFLYRYWTCCFVQNIEDALIQTLEFNRQFTKPLSEREVISATKSAEKAFSSQNKEYKYKNKTLIDLLEITEEEQKKLKTIIGTKEKYIRNNDIRKKKRRNKEGFTKREQNKQDKIKQIRELHRKGFKNIDIASILCISPRYVRTLSSKIRGGTEMALCIRGA